MFSAVAQIFAGFSICAAAVLLTAYLFFLKEMPKSALGLVSSAVLLPVLSALQGSHFYFFDTGYELINQRWYGLLLLAVPMSFFIFSREALVPGVTRSPLHFLHVLPLLAGVFLPLVWLIPIAFVLGAGYSAWFAMYVFGLRRSVNRFAFELFFFCFFAVLAIVLLVLAVAAREIGTEVFYGSYAILTGASFLLVVAALITSPGILTDVSDAAHIAYAKSTLGDIDAAAKMREVEELMTTERLFENDSLTLSAVAAATDLSPHQLSELINSRCGYGFSRFVRKHRVEAAKYMLQDEIAASVLSIGLATGFRSQSNFYAAFREETGQSPGAWRKQQATK